MKEDYQRKSWNCNLNVGKICVGQNNLYECYKIEWDRNIGTIGITDDWRSSEFDIIIKYTSYKQVYGLVEDNLNFFLMLD